MELRDGDLVLRPWTEADVPALVDACNDREIPRWIPVIPHPYTEADADHWIQRVFAETAKNGRSVSWAIRGPDGSLVGGIGFGGLEIGKTHRAEIGYWLAKAYWGRGIMTEAVKKVCEVAFTELSLIRITAHVLVFNVRSERVLAKSEFRLEGLLRMQHFKDGRYLDGKLYARLKEEPMGMPP